MTEQRNYRRINFRTEADVAVGDQHFDCDLVDLALQGALFKAENGLPIGVGEHCTLTITLPASALTMVFKGELIHQRGHFYGFIFLSEDAATMGHLRRLLELNFGDGEEVDQEFHHWLKRN